MTDIKAIALRLDESARRARAVPQLDDPLSLSDAYQVQAASMALRYARGERRIGVKMGFTSQAKMAQMGIDEVIWGRLTSGMLVDDGGEIGLDAFVHPRVEPEIAFLVGDGAGAGIRVAGGAVTGVAPALEIIDSRYRNFRFSLTDVVADNSSSSAFVVGAWSTPDHDLGNLGMVMSFDGEPRQIGSSAAILGDPLRSVEAAFRLAAAAGEPLQPGDIVMAGGATAAEPLGAGIRVKLEVLGLGDVGFRVRA